MGGSAEQTRRLVERFYVEMWNCFDVTVIDSITSEDITFRGSLGDTTRGRSGLAGYVRKVQGAFPDFHNEVETIVAEAGVAMARLRYSGTHLGDLDGLAATGRTVSYEGAARFEIVNGAIADIWVLGDRARLYEQLGLQHPGAASARG